ncbi:uncharacterized protein FTJAE_8335 [Fusarium tjaetaba]|uniref:DUF1593 domain-containing protein n=1 Tax=Fusarium tjaetaba TaxID=1567544 RepID=A0A8H5R6G1_9HYPO|nr:uncharacterized protein FTJAE_8335 [Fusarium tjaetaba]KAF5629965.1 hypothetical protein FTJAE_8335 [Fusarium tjaetaba]
MDLTASAALNYTMPNMFSQLVGAFALFTALPFAQTAPSHDKQCSTARTEHKRRLFVLTDISNEPDDQMSLVRLLTYANEIDIQGISVTTSTWMPDKIDYESVVGVLDGYKKVVNNLNANVPSYAPYPSYKYLLDRVHKGHPVYGRKSLNMSLSDGAKALVKVADKASVGDPLTVSVWGGSAILAEALQHVSRTRSEDAVDAFVEKLRVYAISDQDDTGIWIRLRYPQLFYVVSLHGFSEYTVAAWNGISGEEYRNFDHGGPDSSIVSNDWLEKNIRLGPLGSHYLNWSFIMEGDTPAFLPLVQNGLGDVNHPEWGSWGGRYTLLDHTNQSRVYADTSDYVVGANGKAFTSKFATIWRWRKDYQFDFAARMKWTVNSKYSENNHQPVAIVNGSCGTAPLKLKYKPGSSIVLDASNSWDPDGDDLTYDWFHYREPGGAYGRGLEGFDPSLKMKPVLTPKSPNVNITSIKDNRSIVKLETAKSLNDYHKTQKKFYWLSCIQKNGKTYVYTAPKIEGTWTKASTISNYCLYDAGLLIDDDDSIYVSSGQWTPNGAKSQTWISKLDKNLQVEKQETVFKSNQELGYIEGSRFYKINGTYFLWLTNPGGPYDSWHRVLKNNGKPIKGSGSPHQGAFVETPEGDYYPQSNVTIELNYSSMVDGDRAGLVSLRYDAGWIGIAKDGSSITLQIVDNAAIDPDNSFVTTSKGNLIASKSISGSKIWLRYQISTVSPNRSTFLYSTDRKTFVKFGQDHITKQGGRNVLGRLLANVYWRTANYISVSHADYRRTPDIEKLRPRPYSDGLSHEGLVNLKSEHCIAGDIVIHCTGFDKGDDEFEPSLRCELGLEYDPKEFSRWIMLDEKADRTVDDLLPYLRDAPSQYGDCNVTKRTRHGPNRHYRRLVMLGWRDLPAREEMEVEAGNLNACTRKRYLEQGKKHSYFIYDYIAYIDTPMKDLGLNPFRKSNVFKEWFVRYKPSDYKTILDEYLSLRRHRQEIEGAKGENGKAA